VMVRKAEGEMVHKQKMVEGYYHNGVILCMCCIVEHGEKSINSLQIQ
jgi:hypothetical protein